MKEPINMKTRWKEQNPQQLNMYAIAAQLTIKTNPIQAATHKETAAVFNTFNLTEEDQQNITVIKQQFTDRVFLTRAEKIPVVQKEIQTL